MVLSARGGDFKLTDYDHLMHELDAIPEGVDEFFLCDLGTDPGRVEALVRKLASLSRRMSVTYIDHHYLSEEAKGMMRKSGVVLKHDVNECSGLLTYQHLGRELPQDAKLLALYAAVTDYMDGSPVAVRMMERFDRQLVLLEATLLALAIGRRGDNMAFLRMLVRELSLMKKPHTIGDVPRAAIAQAQRLDMLVKLVAKQSIVLGKIAYIETDQHSTGSTAKLLLGVHNVALGVAFREKHKKGWYEVSFRGTSDVRIHLGKAIGEIANRYGGTGGGHKLAAGCSVPKRSIMDTLKELNGQL